MREKWQAFAIGFSPDGKEGVRHLEDGEMIVYGIPTRKKEVFEKPSLDFPGQTARHSKEYTEEHTFVLGSKKGLRRPVLKETVEKVIVWEEIVDGEKRVTHAASPYAHVPIEDWQNPTIVEISGEDKSAIIAPLVLLVHTKKSS